MVLGPVRVAGGSDARSSLVLMLGLGAFTYKRQVKVLEARYEARPERPET